MGAIGGWIARQCRYHCQQRCYPLFVNTNTSHISSRSAPHGYDMMVWIAYSARVWSEYIIVLWLISYFHFAKCFIMSNGGLVTPCWLSDRYSYHTFETRCSFKAHYSVVKAGHMLGFGSDNVIFVETDDAGRMKPSSLEKAILDCKNAVSK